jgi:tripartite-type tricarboxylate transporter receptor subunit TctC
MDPVSALSHTRAGRWRMLAVSTAQRVQAVPDLPTMKEAGVPGVELLTWFAALVPSATPRPIIDKLNAWFKDVLLREETKKFLNSFGGDPFIATPEEGQALFRQSAKDWEGYVRAAKIEPQ